MSQDDLTAYIVWVGPCDELAFGTVTFKSQEEKTAYCRGVSDANGWDHAVIFNDAKTAKQFIDQNRKGVK